jgi:putative SOS response-associated peptidase YedK
MCGRYRLTRSQKHLKESFNAYDEVEVFPRLQHRPLTVRRNHPPRCSKACPHTFNHAMGTFAFLGQGHEHGYKTINARAETVATTPSFREPFQSQRCLVPADGFREWQRNGKTRQPYCFEVNEGELFAFAGLWDRWTNPQGELIESCTILTTTPNSLLSDIHDRMPVILSPDNYDLWLDPAFRNTSSVSEMLKLFD